MGLLSNYGPNMASGSGHPGGVLGRGESSEKDPQTHSCSPTLLLKVVPSA